MSSIPFISYYLKKDYSNPNFLLLLAFPTRYWGCFWPINWSTPPLFMRYSATKPIIGLSFVKALIVAWPVAWSNFLEAAPRDPKKKIGTVQVYHAYDLLFH